MEELEKLLHALDMPGGFIPRVLEAAASLPLPPDAPDGDGAAGLARQLSVALQERAQGVWKGLPEDIWLDTMKCFSRFVREDIRCHGRPCFTRGWWTVRQIHAKLFRVGELEYELREENGRRDISLHIPSDARMAMDRLDASVTRAKSFLQTFFPGWAGLPMVCESWLLSPALKQLLPENSHIRGFQRAFRIDRTDPEARGVLYWVYHLSAAQQEAIPLEQLPEETTLQRSMKAFLLAGGKIGEAAGELVRPFQAQEQPAMPSPSFSKRV